MTGGRIIKIKAAIVNLGLGSCFLACASVSVALILFGYQSHQDTCDYQLFWSAGRYVLSGQTDLIYPPLSSNDLSNKLWKGGFYTYPPHFGALFAPLSALPLPQAMAIFELLLGASVAGSALLFSKMAGGSNKILKALFVPTSLFVVAHGMAIGQPGTMVNLLPLTAGYVALTSKRFLLAGMLWGMILLKPQPLPILCSVLAAIAITCWFDRKGGGSAPTIEPVQLRRWLFGFLIAAAGSALLACTVFGAANSVRWIHAAALLNHYIYNRITWGLPALLASIPAIIISSCPLPVVPAQYIAKTVIFTAWLVEFAMLLSIARARLAATLRLNLMLIAALVSLPLCSPYLGIYDLNLFVLPAWIIFLGELPAELTTVLRRATILLWLVLDVYLLSLPQQVNNGITIGNIFTGCALLSYFLVVFSSIFFYLRKSTLLPSPKQS